MKKCVFTICAKNYLGLALILEKSLKKINPGTTFYVFIADEFSEFEKYDLPSNILHCREILSGYINSNQWDEMSFKYNLTEFCTSIKPFCFMHLLEKSEYEKVVYLDPDVFLFSSFSPVFELLDQYKIVLTPHITTFGEVYQGDRTESGLLNTGVFNLGFLALRGSAEVFKMLNWWGARLRDKCYIDVLDSFFTDQKWMDFLPCFFDAGTLLISKNIGLNVAPWNFFEREVFLENDEYYIKLRVIEEACLAPEEDASHKTEKLIFVHFSGYDYIGLLNGKILQNNIQNIEKYKDYEPVCEAYGNVLNQEKEVFNRYINQTYSYDTFNNSKQKVTSFIRRIYRGLIEEGVEIIEPFAVHDGSFYAKLKTSKLLIQDNAVNIDKLNKFTLSDVSSKLLKINFVMRILYRIIGLNKYILLLRFMRPYSRVENHIHLIDKKYSTKLR